MKKSAYTHSELIQSRNFWDRIARKECGDFHKIERKDLFYMLFDDLTLRQNVSNPLTTFERYLFHRRS